MILLSLSSILLIFSSRWRLQSHAAPFDGRIENYKSAISSVSTQNSTEAEYRDYISVKLPTTALKEDREEIADEGQRLHDEILDEILHYGKSNLTSDNNEYKLRYDIYDGRLRRFRYEEKTPDGLITGEIGYHHDNGVVRGVRYTAEPGVHPKLIYQTLLKFLSL